MITDDRPRTRHIPEQRAAQQRHCPVAVREHAEAAGLADKEVLPPVASEAAADDIRAGGSLRAHKHLHEFRLWNILLVQKHHPLSHAGPQTLLPRRGHRVARRTNHAHSLVTLGRECRQAALERFSGSMLVHNHIDRRPLRRPGHSPRLRCHDIRPIP